MTVKNREKLEKSRVALTIEVGAEEFDAAIAKSYQKNRRKYRVPGFRPGKASRKMIERMFGVEVFFEDALNEAAPEAYEAAVKEQELRPVGMPELSIETPPSRDGFTFRAIVAVYPEVTLGEYKGLTAPRPEVTVTPADVDERIRQLQERNTRLVSVDRAAKEGDSVVIDFEGFLNGEPFQGGKGQNYTLELGSHNFVAGFEEQLVGMCAGDERDLDITFPDNYAQELAGKAVVFKVKVHEVKEKDSPEIDDEFAKDVSEFDTLEELREDLSKKIAEERDKNAQRAFEDALMEKVADNITVDPPDIMIDQQARQFIENLKLQVAQQGIPYEQYLQLTGADESKLLQDAREPALHQVRMDLAVMAIINAEHLEASDEDVQNEYQRLASEFGMDAESIKRYYDEERIREEVLTRKAIAIVADSATAVKPEPVSEAAENAPSEQADTPSTESDTPSEQADTPSTESDTPSEAQTQSVESEPKADEPAPEVVKADEPAPEAAKADEPAPEAVKADEPAPEAVKADEPAPSEGKADEPAPKKPRRSRAKKDTAKDTTESKKDASDSAEAPEKPKRTRKKAAPAVEGEEKPKRTTTRRKKTTAKTADESTPAASETPTADEKSDT